jgi:hypothetical protein
LWHVWLKGEVHTGRTEEKGTLGRLGLDGKKILRGFLKK